MKTASRQTNRSCADGALSLKLMTAMAVVFAALALTLHAAQPAWWTLSGAVNANPRNDSSVVTQGQLKKMTYEAVQEMNTNLVGGAGSTLNTLTTGWSNSYLAHGITTNDHIAMNEGQVKYIASLVYPPLVSGGYMANHPSWAQTNALVDTNLATIGELKQVFAFEFAIPQVPVNLSVQLGTTSAVLNWTDPVISVQSFNIQVSTDGGVTWGTPFSVPGTTFSDTVTGLTPGLNYAFRVSASNHSGTSSYSSNDAAPVIALSTPLGATLVP